MAWGWPWFWGSETKKVIPMQGEAVGCLGPSPVATSPSGHPPSLLGTPLAGWVAWGWPLHPDGEGSPERPAPVPTGPGAMAAKPEKRVASSVFITLVPPRRHVAVPEEVRQAAGEARHGRPWEPPAPVKAPGAGAVRKPSPWAPPGRAATVVPAVSPQLSNGGKKGVWWRAQGTDCQPVTHSRFRRLGPCRPWEPPARCESWAPSFLSW